MLSISNAQKNERFKGMLQQGLEDYVNQLIIDTRDAYDDQERPQNPPFGAGLIWNPREQSILVQIGQMRQTGMTYSDIAARLNQDGLHDRLGKPFAADQVRRYMRQGLLSEDSLRQVMGDGYKIS